MCLAATLIAPLSGLASELIIDRSGSLSRLHIDTGETFHSTEDEVVEGRLVDVPGLGLQIALWNERDVDGDVTPHYAIMRDGALPPEVHRTSYTIGLGGSIRDPATEPPNLPASLIADESCGLHLVQFITHSMRAYRDAVAEAGGRIHRFVGHHTYIVEMNAEARETVRSLPFVRWVGPYHPGYRVGPALREELSTDVGAVSARRYHIRLFDASEETKTLVASRIYAMGGGEVGVPPSESVLHAVLSAEQLRTVISWDEVEFVDLSRSTVAFMDVARDAAGAIYIENIAGYTGDGVVGEIMDKGDPDRMHEGLQGICLGGEEDGWACRVGYPCEGEGTCVRKPTPHNSKGVVEDHPTKVFGCLFWRALDPYSPEPDLKGMLPRSQGVYADIDQMMWHGGTVDRKRHTCQLVTANADNCCDIGDANCPYDAVFQSNSAGANVQSYYSPEAAEMDDTLFMFDLAVMHCIGDEGDGEVPLASPVSWGKNVVSVGGVIHYDTATLLDDTWSGGIIGRGPAPDGRIKPDLVHFADAVTTTTSVPSGGGGAREEGVGEFSGTSAATPIVAGHFGLFFEMWDDQVFNVCDQSGCSPSGGAGSVFLSRPHMTTAKAMLINTANQYCFNNPAECPDSSFLREREGWGIPNVGRLYLLRDSFPLIVDETHPLDWVTPGNNKVTYQVNVPADTHALRATMVYADPAGAAYCDEQDPCRVNDITLKVTSPSGTCYFGNHGLREGNWSQPSSMCFVYGSPDDDTINTVENVFVESPEEGVWAVRLIAVEINQDGHVHYVNDDPSECIPNPPPGCYDPLDVTDDVDFALVVSLDMDCNQNGQSDANDILDPFGSEDCNENAVPDECEPELDCDSSGVPDACEFPVGACCNGVSCDLVTETCCASQGGTFLGAETECGDDCNLNQVPDECDIAYGTSDDCNENDVLDECDIAAAPSLDCYDTDWQLDACQPHIPKGACCLPPEASICVDGVTECWCTANGGWYAGDDLTCGPSGCDVW